VEVNTTDGKRALAHVRRSEAAPVSDLAGTDVESALRAARQDVTFESVMLRHVLYDHDADKLASTRLYRTYAEACDDANDLNNVQVLTVALPGCSANDDEQDDRQ
jgi:hypothetical protein